MNKERIIKKCPYCGSEQIGVGYQKGSASISLGFRSCKLIHEICTDCGSILYSRVEDPKMFKKQKLFFWEKNK